MRDLLKSTRRWLRVGWFWPLALLMLPACILFFDEVGPEPEDPSGFQPGPSPTSAIMCEIPKFVREDADDCADADEAEGGMSLAYAAIALNLGETSTIGLDFSTAATTACLGMPRKIEYYGVFPDGLAVCLNCETQIDEFYADAIEVCHVKCKELLDADELPTPEEVDVFCATKARPSTNFDKDTCFEDFCTSGGTPVPEFTDPRRNPEDVMWTDFINTSAVGNTLSFTGPDPGTGLFSAGAASAQLITKGDAWVEFAAGEGEVSHAVGVRASCADVTNCQDMDPTPAGTPLLLSLNVTGEVNVVANGTAVIGGPFSAYLPGERFRIHVKDRHDSTADVLFFRYTTPCEPNMPCGELPFFTYTGPERPNYPLRVDAMFREPNATLQTVTIMRIK